MTTWQLVLFGFGCMCVGVAAGEWARYLTRVVYLSATEAEKEEAKRAIRSMHQYDVKVDRSRPKL